MNNISEILLGGAMAPEQTQLASVPQQAQAQPSPNPFAGLLNVATMMDSDPKGAEERFRELARRGMKAPDFEPETFLQYVQTQQSSGNQAMANAGQGTPTQGTAPVMPMPQTRQGY